MTPTDGVSQRLKLPLPAPADTMPAAQPVAIDLDTFDDLEVVTIRRAAPTPMPEVPSPDAPVTIPLWAVLASGTLLFAVVATTVALVL